MNGISGRDRQSAGAYMGGGRKIGFECPYHCCEDGECVISDGKGKRMTTPSGKSRINLLTAMIAVAYIHGIKGGEIR
jgi:hypothetical protein